MITPLPPEALVLETDRLILRPFALEDADLAIALWCEAEVMRYVSEPDTPQAIRDYMPNVLRRGAGGRIGTWAISQKKTGRGVGEIFLLPTSTEGDDTDWSQLALDAYPNDVIEVGYLFVKDAWGQGFATEACNRMLRFAFEQTDLDSVYATIDPENTASEHVLTKCGLHFIGLHRAWGEDNTPWYQVTRAEWEEHIVR